MRFLQNRFTLKVNDMNTLQISIRINTPTEWPADQLEEAKAESGVDRIVADIAARYPGSTVVLDGVEVAGPSAGSGFSNGYTS